MGVIKSVATEFNIDSTMLSSLPLAINKHESARSQFDVVILNQFNDALKKVLEEQSTAVAAQEPARAERQGVVDTAKSTRDAAAAGLDAREEALSNAKTAAKNAAAAVTNAEKAIKNYITDMKVIMDGFDAAKVDLKDFQEGVLTQFNELKDLVAPPPEPEIQAPDEAPADAPMADAAAEGAPAAMESS